MRILILISMLLFATNPCPSRAADISDDRYVEGLKGASKFIRALKEDDKKAVAHLIDYPFEREFPLPAIENEGEFIENWDDFFNVENTAELIGDSEPWVHGWRGVAIGHGQVWFDESSGKIFRVQLRTPAFEEKWQKAKLIESSSIHPIAQKYQEVLVNCFTSTKHIRIQRHGEDDYRYFVWPKNSRTSIEPEMSLRGEFRMEGTIHAKYFTFKNGGITYVLSSNHSEGCGGDSWCLDVSKNGMSMISEQGCAER